MTETAGRGVFAKEKIYKGETLLVNQAFIKQKEDEGMNGGSQWIDKMVS